VQHEKSTSVYATYDFGVASATLGHITNQAASTASKIKTNMLGVKVPVSATGTVVLGYYDVTNDTAASANSNAYSVNYLYALSKRTTLYALFAKSDVEANANPAVSNLPEFKAGTGNATGINQAVTAVGVRHSF
jgi:predicted porin